MRIGEFQYDGAELTIYAERQRGQLAIYVEDEYGDRIIDVSTYVPRLWLDRDEFVLNIMLKPRMVRQILDTGYFEDTGRHDDRRGYPVWRLAGATARFPLVSEHGRYGGVEQLAMMRGR